MSRERGQGGTRKLRQQGVAAPLAAGSLIGQTLLDRYHVLDAIGRGGMGTVYRARHVLLGKDVALKVLHPKLLAVEGGAERLEREARAIARIDSPHVVRIDDFGVTDDGLTFLVMEYLRGDSLRQELARGPVEPERARRIVDQVLAALQAAHDSGILHRDLKPENIFLLHRPELAVKLLDFGLAKVFDGTWTEEGKLTATGVLVGTPHYMAPEQAGSGGAVGPPTDIYSVGVLLYELLTGVRPFDAPGALAVLLMHQCEAPSPPSGRRPGLSIPPRLEAAALRALRKEPEQRFGSAAEMREALRGASAPPAAARRSRRWIVAGAGASVALVAAATALLLWPPRQPQTAASPKKTPVHSPSTPSAPDATVARTPPGARPPSPATGRPGPDASALPTLEVRAIPASAEIHIDGQRVGVGYARVRPGRAGASVTLSVRARGHRSHRRRLVLDRHRSFTVRLRPLGSRLDPSVELEANPYRRSGRPAHR